MYSIPSVIEPDKYYQVCLEYDTGNSFLFFFFFKEGFGMIANLKCGLSVKEVKPKQISLLDGCS